MRYGASQLALAVSSHRPDVADHRASAPAGHIEPGDDLELSAQFRRPAAGFDRQCRPLRRAVFELRLHDDAGEFYHGDYGIKRRVHRLSRRDHADRELQQPQPAHQPIGPGADLRRRRQCHLGRAAQLHLGRREPARRHHLSGADGQGHRVQLRRAQPPHRHRKHAHRRRRHGHHIVHLVRRAHLPGAQCQQRGDAFVVCRGRIRSGSPAQPFYYGPDQIGSVRRVFASAASAPAYSYDPYGNALQGTAPLTDFNYAGMFYNADSGLYLRQYRAYDPVAGRWLSRDPMGEVGDPTANLYRYVDGNPIGLTDLDWGSRWEPTQLPPSLPTP